MENCKFESDVIFQIRHLSKCLKKDFDERLESFGLTAQQGRILFCVCRNYEAKTEIHQSDIEKFFQLSKSSVSEMVSRMIANQLIGKVKVNNRYVLVPTQKGQSIVSDIHESKKGVIKKLFDGFTEEEINNITNYIKKMTDNIEKEGKKC
ncbi:MAG: MarR family winged helix-turn-helix transcriptional regulator [Bacilli bacterium]|nr:MarR family winged helix-turn-helix transcriptional regulator [Bacilli bacterium]